MKDAIKKLTEARNGLRASARAHDEQGNSYMAKYLFERAQLIDDALTDINTAIELLLQTVKEQDESYQLDVQDCDESRRAYRETILAVTA